jgi:hypothetical protein
MNERQSGQGQDRQTEKTQPWQGQG